MKILLSSVGRRGYLVKFFRDALRNEDEVWGGDNSKYAPAFRYCDKAVLLPEVNDPAYATELADLCRDNGIDMIVPLIDPELSVLAAERKRFDDNGTMVVVSPVSTVETTYDKYLTYQRAQEAGIGVPTTVTSIEQAQRLLSDGQLEWPVVVKPRKGSASANITYCDNDRHLRYAFETCPEPMIQQCVKGQEYNYDLFGDKNCRPISVFCKRKLAMRAGETDKAVSTDDKKLVAFGLKIAEVFEFFGPVDVDVMVDSDGPKLLEINPRFGGGYPCAHLCGAGFPAKLISIFKNEALTPDIGSCPAGVYMFKQDEIITARRENLAAIRDWQQCQG